MATNTETGRHEWPFMSPAISEAAAVKPEAWAALSKCVSRWAPRPHQHKSLMTERLCHEYRTACEQRAREGQAAIGAAVKTLLSTYTH